MHRARQERKLRIPPAPFGRGHAAMWFKLRTEEKRRQAAALQRSTT